MRVLFALVVFRAQQDLFAVQPITVPNGLARLVPLDFLLSHPAIRCCEILFVLALGLYVCRIGLGFALPVLTLISIASSAIPRARSITVIRLFRSCYSRKSGRIFMGGGGGAEANQVRKPLRDYRRLRTG